ncbi:hypothetical protein V757_02185 [Pelistega indica]|uniref:Uncharacterized protein n=1 Tax=Pelistega indica TaxID=1414851 RepID=V8G8B1_9BURK|nr:hypothetical protein [Pelistega indica]ETD72769.1 hypothetical protein V757_02185 [Pelistega indica]
MSISGTGQPTDPIIISVDPTDTAGAYAISADPTTITVTGKGTSIQDPITIGLKPVITAGKKGNFTINSYGQIIGYADTGEAVVNVVGESPIKTSKLGDTVRVSLDMDSLWTLLNSRAADDAINGIAAGSFETRDGKLVSYDRLGRIVSVENIPKTGTDDGDAGGTN